MNWSRVRDYLTQTYTPDTSSETSNRFVKRITPLKQPGVLSLRHHFRKRKIPFVYFFALVIVRHFGRGGLILVISAGGVKTAPTMCSNIVRRFGFKESTFFVFSTLLATSFVTKIIYHEHIRRFIHIYFVIYRNISITFQYI